MAASHGSGCHSPPTIGRSVDRVFEEAQYTGEIHLSGRKLRDYPKICNKYDLSDTVVADVSRNRLLEVPHEICAYLFIEKINCYHNVIRFIPDSIQQLQVLTQLNLSRNQLSVLPPSLCLLGALEVLSVNNNKLVSLPEEISKLKNLMDLDVSCNEISHLPVQLGDLASLRCLNLRNNFLIVLPLEISRLQLYRLDFSCNRIEKIPTIFRKMETLQHLVLGNNPLTLPPSRVCIKGKQHVMKYLQTEAVREDRKKSMMMSGDVDMKSTARKSLPPQQSNEEFKNMLLSPESKWKRHTLLNDSGYSTTDGLERNGWHTGGEMIKQAEENNNEKVKFVRQDKSHHNFYQNCHLQQQLGSNSSSCSLPCSDPSPHQQKTSVSAAHQLNLQDKFLQPGKNLLNQAVGCQQQSHHGFMHQHSSQFVLMHQHSPPSALIHMNSSHSYPQNSGKQTESSLSSISDHRIPVSRTFSSSHINGNHSSSSSNSLYGPEQDVLVHRHRSNSSLSDYQQRHRTNSSVSHTPVGGSSIYSSQVSLITGGLKLAAELSRSSSLLPRPLQSATHLNDRQHFSDDRHVYQAVPSQSVDTQSEPSQSVDTQSESPPPTPLTPPTPPIIMTGDMEDEFTRELKRQKAEYERKKKQAELIRVQQEEEEEEREKVERRMAALKLKEEQKSLIEKQREGNNREGTQQQQQHQQQQNKRQEELRLQKDKRKEDVDRNKEDEAQRLQETVRNQDGVQILQTRDTQSKHQDKNSNNYLHHTGESPQNQNRPHQPASSSTSRLPKPPSSLPVLGIMGSPSSASSLSSTTSSSSSTSSSSIFTSPQQQPDDSKHILHENRSDMSSHSFKEQHRLTSGIQYRRTSSDTLKRPCQPTNPVHQQEDVSHVSRNGIGESSQQSSASTTLSVSPRNSVSHLAKPASPSGSTSQLVKPSSPSGPASHLARPTGTKSAVPRATTGQAASAQSQALRKPKTSEDRSTAPSSTPTKATKPPGTGNLKQPNSALGPVAASVRHSSNSSATDDDTKVKKGPSTPLEILRPKSRLEEQTKKMMQMSALKKSDSTESDKKISTKPPTSGFGLVRGRSGVPRAQEDHISNLTNQKREELLREESEQMEKLRQIIESRLRVILPDNLAEALRDGVVLCHLANQIRPRSVGSIHVPSPAVPKLTLAKCRRNVDNFLDACRKIGVDQEQLCIPQDILEEKGIIRMTATVTALVAVGNNPKQSAL